MSAFGIFALILTTAYIIYFAVTISRDIVAGRKKAEDSPESETFEISSSAQDEVEASIQKLKDNPTHEESVAVIETADGGFRVGDLEFETMNVTIPSQSTDSTKEEESSTKAEEVENSIDNFRSQMEDHLNKIEHELSVPSDEFETYIINQQSISNSHLVYKKDVAAEESLKEEDDDGPERRTVQEEERDRM